MLPPIHQTTLQAIALDLDGTLLTSNGFPSPKTVTLLQSRRQAGTRIILASGRMTNRMAPIAELIGGPLTLIAYNGARVVEWKDSNHHECTHTSEIPETLRLSIVNLCRDRDLFLNVYSGSAIYGYHPKGDFRFGEFYHAQNGAEYSEFFDTYSSLPATEVAKLLIVTKPEDREPLYLECSARFANQASIVKSNPEYLEFMAPGVNKGTTLQRWMQQNKIEADAVAAFGDAENDFTMLQSVGFGVAVANCTPGLKADMIRQGSVSRSARISNYSNDEDVIVRELEAWPVSP